MPSAPSLSHHHFLVGAMFKPFLVMGGKNGLVLPTSNFQLFLPGRNRNLGLLGAPVPGLPQRLARLAMARRNVQNIIALNRRGLFQP